jgi:hypothetical protein
MQLEEATAAAARMRSVWKIVDQALLVSIGMPGRYRLGGTRKLARRAMNWMRRPHHNTDI